MCHCVKPKDILLVRTCAAASLSFSLVPHTRAHTQHTSDLTLESRE